MKIEYIQDAEVIRPLFENWEECCRAEEFGFFVSVDAAVIDTQNWLETKVGTIIVGRDDTTDEPIGFLAIFAIPSPIGGQTVALEKYWYADPNRKMVGPKLFVKARDWAKEQGCSHLILAASNLASDHHDSVVKFCKNVGMKTFETTFITELSEV